MKQFTLMLGLKAVANIEDAEDCGNGAMFRYRGQFKPLPYFDEWESTFEHMWTSPQFSESLDKLMETPIYLLDEAETVWLLLAPRHPQTGSSIPFHQPDANGEVQVTLKPLNESDSQTFQHNISEFYKKASQREEPSKQ